ncbi:GNAT family N-acetyltransferase [Carbonactinospora thermoautotrophica]|uniref:GNAT family N-acetyltransferase n=1 Tax=Carbonactinospora thermoautotrophica TaxID=1469144 RepID=UPI000AC90228|nr:GNAT family N-acetyltransferase [Carbonactinospora thermoautotrophica]
MAEEQSAHAFPSLAAVRPAPVTPRRELRLPTFEDLDALADLGVEGGHDPGYMPLGVLWTDQPPRRLALALLQYRWSAWGAWQPDDSPGAGLLRDVVGTQGVHGRDFALVATGSWLGRRFQGRGIGTGMRAAVRHPAFAAVAAHAGGQRRLPGGPSSATGRSSARSAATRRLPSGRPRILGTPPDGSGRDPRPGAVPAAVRSPRRRRVPACPVPHARAGTGQR